MKVVAVDLDGTLCPEGPAHERPYQPHFEETRELVNRAYDSGYRVVLFTARNWTDQRMTEDWLAAHGVRVHQVVCGKIPYAFLLDDRAGSRPEELRRFLTETEP